MLTSIDKTVDMVSFPPLQDPPLASSSAEKAGALQPCSFTSEHIWLDPQRKSQSEHHPPCLLSSQCFSRLTVDVVKNG